VPDRGGAPGDLPRGARVKLNPVFNRRFGQWRIYHDQPCQRGETSIVAAITTTGNDDEDERIARMICERFNVLEDAEKSLFNAIIYGRSDHSPA